MKGPKPPKDYTEVVQAPDTVQARVIAVVHSPFTERHGTPRQPLRSQGQESGITNGTVELVKSLSTDFLADLDITGGNSGSPVLNGNGDLIGLAFDGNWEAMSGDIAFEPELQRTISVDIRYVMWVIDKMAGARNLIDEIDFVVASAPAKDEAKDPMQDPPKDQARPQDTKGR